MRYYISLSSFIKPNAKINTNNSKCKKLTNYLRTEYAQTEFRATTFQTVCYQLKQNVNQTVQFESQQYKPK